MPALKEIHFFDDETCDWSNPDYRRLHAHFRLSDGRLRGEATPIYIYWPNSLERIHSYNTGSKFIVLLRHPVFRAYSHWRMATRMGEETWSFERAISEEGRERVRTAPGGVHRVFSYVERGMYGDQVSRILALFGRDQVLFLRTDNLWLEPASTLDQVERFLGISSAPAPVTRYTAPLNRRRRFWRGEQREWHDDNMPHEVRQHLELEFPGEIQLTAKLTGLDLSDWFQSDYCEPMKR